MTDEEIAQVAHALRHHGMDKAADALQAIMERCAAAERQRDAWKAALPALAERSVKDGIALAAAQAEIEKLRAALAPHDS